MHESRFSQPANSSKEMKEMQSRKVKSATRPEEDLPKTKATVQSTAQMRENPKLASPSGLKITDRPSSASAGQRFIGKQ